MLTETPRDNQDKADNVTEFYIGVKCRDLRFFAVNPSPGAIDVHP